MKTLLISLVAAVALFCTLSGLLMINYPHGIIPGIHEDILQASGLKDLFIFGLMFLIVGVVHIGAFFSLFQAGQYQYRWSILAGLLLITSMIVIIIFTTFYSPLEFFVAGAGVMITLLSLQLKGKWAA